MCIILLKLSEYDKILIRSRIQASRLKKKKRELVLS